MSGTGDPFGRGGDEEKTDAFGNPVRPEEETERRDPLWLPPEGASQGAPPAAERERAGRVPDWEPPPGVAPAPKEHPTAPPQPDAQTHGGFLPPTDAPPEREAWWTEPQAPGGVSGPGGTASPSGGHRPGETADWGMRALSAVVDFCIRLAIAGVFAGIGAALSGGSEDGIVVGLLIGAFIAIFVYAPVLLARWDGQTIGHRVTETRIVMVNGERMSGGRGFVREVLVKNFLIEGIGQFTFFVLPLVNYLWPLWDERDEALHDKMCNTRVVKASSLP